MYCEKCGAENLETATICQNCGGVFVFSKPSRISGMAIASIILGISGITMFALMGIAWIIGLIFGFLALYVSGITMFALMGTAWIISLVFGILSLNKINKSGGLIKGKGFAVTGIATSSSGLGLLLITIGFVMFFTSAQAISARRNFINMRNSGLITTVDRGQPTIAGWVNVFTEQSDTEANYTAVLFTPDDPYDTASYIRQHLTCGSADTTPLEIAWQFKTSTDEGDLYDFTIIMPINHNATSSTTVMITYDGTEQIIFESNTYKITITPPELEPQE